MNVILSWVAGALYLRLWAFRAGISRWTVKNGKYTLAYVHWNDKVWFSFGLPAKPIRNRWHLTVGPWRIKK